MAGFLKGYWRNRQRSQPDHIEICIEKLTVRTILQRVAQEFTIPVSTIRGMGSTPPKKKLVNRFRYSQKEKLVLLVVSDLDPAGDALLVKVARVCRERPNTIAGALTLARAFQDQLQSARAAIESEHDEKLSQETEIYQQRTDGRWLEREGERLLVLTESRYVKVRSTLVDRLMEWFAEAVRMENGGESTSPFSADIEKFAKMYSVPELLRRYQALVRLQENLSRNIQEALAVEVAFYVVLPPLASRLGAVRVDVLMLVNVKSKRAADKLQSRGDSVVRFGPGAAAATRPWQRPATAPPA